jgi:hypothetical protein
MAIEGVPAGWEIVGPAPRACSRCPWRLANQGQPHPHDFYSRANLRRLWAGLKNGERMTCHPTDPRMCEFEGYEQQAGKSVTRECTGALTLIQRELHLFMAAAKQATAAGDTSALKRYRDERVRGQAMTPAGLQIHAVSLASTGDVPVLGIRAMPGLELAQINDLEVGYSTLGAWTPIDRFVIDAQERAAA